MGGGATLDVFAWLRSVEETAGRAGLLASGNLTVAANVLAIAGASPEANPLPNALKGCLPSACRNNMRR